MPWSLSLSTEITLLRVFLMGDGEGWWWCPQAWHGWAQEDKEPRKAKPWCPKTGMRVRETPPATAWEESRKKKWLKIKAYFGDGNHVGGKDALSFLMILEDLLIPDQLPSLLLWFIFVEDLQFFQMLQVIKFAVVRVNISLLEHNYFIEICCPSQYSGIKPQEVT